MQRTNVKYVNSFKNVCKELKLPSILEEISLENVGRFQNTFNFEEKSNGKILVDFKNRREIQLKNVGRFQKFGGNTNVNRLLFPDGWMDGWMDGRSVGRSGNFFLTTLRPSGM